MDHSTKTAHTPTHLFYECTITCLAAEAAHARATSWNRLLSPIDRNGMERKREQFVAGEALRQWNTPIFLINNGALLPLRMCTTSICNGIVYVWHLGLLSPFPLPLFSPFFPIDPAPHRKRKRALHPGGQSIEGPHTLALALLGMYLVRSTYSAYSTYIAGNAAVTDILRH